MITYADLADTVLGLIFLSIFTIGALFVEGYTGAMLFMMAIGFLLSLLFNVLMSEHCKVMKNKNRNKQRIKLYY